MKRYIIEVPEEITADNIGVALEGVVDYTTIEETTMKSQAEIEERIQQQYSMLDEDDCTVDFNAYNAMWSEYNLLNWVLGK